MSDEPNLMFVDEHSVIVKDIEKQADTLLYKVKLLEAQLCETAELLHTAREQLLCRIKELKAL